MKSGTKQEEDITNEVKMFFHKHPLIAWNILAVLAFFIHWSLMLVFFFTSLVFWSKRVTKAAEQKHKQMITEIKVSLEPKDERKAECPNCHKALSKIPGAKKKCPHCGDFMYVRTNFHNIRVVVTEKDADVIDFTNYILPIADACGISRGEISDCFQSGRSFNDALWSVINFHLLKNQKDGNWDVLISLYHVSERICLLENRSTKHIVKRRSYFELLRLKEMGMKTAIVITVLDESCDACKNLDGKEFDIDEAMRIQPLPPPDCKCQHCVCRY